MADIEGTDNLAGALVLSKENKQKIRDVTFTDDEAKSMVNLDPKGVLAVLKEASNLPNARTVELCRLVVQQAPKRSELFEDAEQQAADMQLNWEMYSEFTEEQRTMHKEKVARAREVIKNIEEAEATPNISPEDEMRMNIGSIDTGDVEDDAPVALVDSTVETKKVQVSAFF